MADQRFDVLWRIAELYTDLTDPLNGPSHVRGDGAATTGMPPTYTQTVREYERLVKVLRDDRNRPLTQLADGRKVSARQCWWHLNEWHHKARRVIRHVPVTTPGKRGRRLAVRHADGSPVTVPQLSWLRDPAADEQVARQAVVLIGVLWDAGRIGEPMLPAAVVETMSAAA